MTDPTTPTLTALAALPRLAAASVPRKTAGRGGGDGIRTAPTSTPPPGVDLDAIDVSHGKQHPHLLARLSQCVRVVVEEHPVSYVLPLLAEEAEVSWASECGWLVATADWWQTDEWCTQWIGAEVEGIHRTLWRLTEAQVDRLACSVCGVRLDAYTTDALMVATCPSCEAVVGMRPRLTDRQRADARARAAGKMLRAILGG